MSTIHRFAVKTRGSIVPFEVPCIDYTGSPFEEYEHILEAATPSQCQACRSETTKGDNYCRKCGALLEDPGSGDLADFKPDTDPTDNALISPVARHSSKVRDSKERARLKASAKGLELLARAEGDLMVAKASKNNAEALRHGNHMAEFQTKAQRLRERLKTIKPDSLRGETAPTKFVVDPIDDFED